jgi:hypothetical protein
MNYSSSYDGPIYEYFGMATIAGKADFGASSPEKPALVKPDPLSITIP